jgi:hypothetical protein
MTGSTNVRRKRDLFLAGPVVALPSARAQTGRNAGTHHEITNWQKSADPARHIPVYDDEELAALFAKLDFTPLDEHDVWFSASGVIGSNRGTQRWQPLNKSNPFSPPNPRSRRHTAWTRRSTRLSA